MKRTFSTPTFKNTPPLKKGIKQQVEDDLKTVHDVDIEFDFKFPGTLYSLVLSTYYSRFSNGIAVISVGNVDEKLILVIYIYFVYPTDGKMNNKIRYLYATQVRLVRICCLP